MRNEDYHDLCDPVLSAVYFAAENTLLQILPNLL
jgi:hypothetical protein